MKSTSRDFLSTLFQKGEEVCFSPDKFAYKSVPWESLDSEIELESQGKYNNKKIVSEDDILLVAINPIKGEKNDANTTAFRTFLIELDDGNVYDQKIYIDSLKMPYSVCVFSGNKSLHYGITLDTELPTETIWRDINQWILNIVKKADQQNKSPTKSIRFPDSRRKDGKQLMQTLVDIKGRVEFGQLVQWLDKYPDLNPMYAREAEERERRIKKLQMGEIENPTDLIPTKVFELLSDGVIANKFGGRNNGWHWVCRRFAEAGFDEDSMEYMLSPYFFPEGDFGINEWKSIIKNAVRNTR